MAKLGDNESLSIYLDKAVDFMASTQAYMEYLKKWIPVNQVPESIPEEKVAYYLERLGYYRDLYKPVCDKENKE